jgi:hypothetical protein
MEKVMTLEELEETVVAGERALRDRNRLLSELNAEGQGKAELCRRLNVVRSALGAQTLTRGAVYLNIRRYRERQEITAAESGDVSE